MFPCRMHDINPVIPVCIGEKLSVLSRFPFRMHDTTCQKGRLTLKISVPARLGWLLTGGHTRTIHELCSELKVGRRSGSTHQDCVSGQHNSLHTHAQAQARECTHHNGEEAKLEPLTKGLLQVFFILFSSLKFYPSLVKLFLSPHVIVACFLSKRRETKDFAHASCKCWCAQARYIRCHESLVCSPVMRIGSSVGNMKPGTKPLILET